MKKKDFLDEIVDERPTVKRMLKIERLRLDMTHELAQALGVERLYGWKDLLEFVRRDAEAIQAIQYIAKRGEVE